MAKTALLKDGASLTRPLCLHHPAMCHAGTISARTDARPGLTAPLSGPLLQLPADVVTALALGITPVSLKRLSGKITEHVLTSLMEGQRESEARHDGKTSRRSEHGVNG